MKSTTPALTAHIAQEVTTLATGWRLFRKFDSKIFAFTDHDADVVIAGKTYKSETGYFATAYKTTHDLAVDNSSADFILDDLDITEDDMRAGKWDGTTIRVFKFDYTNPDGGTIILRDGVLGEVTLEADRSMGKVELRGLIQHFTQRIGDIFAVDCRYNLGDLGCAVDLDPPEWFSGISRSVHSNVDQNANLFNGAGYIKPTVRNGFWFLPFDGGITSGPEPSWDISAIGAQTVDGGLIWKTIHALSLDVVIASVIDNSNFTIDFLKGAGYWDLGMVKATSGNNNGFVKMIKQSTESAGSPSEDQIEVYREFPFDLQVGDTMIIVVGCDRRLPTCKDKFRNIFGFGAEPFTPTQDITLINVPTASGTTAESTLDSELDVTDIDENPDPGE